MHVHVNPVLTRHHYPLFVGAQTAETQALEVSFPFFPLSEPSPDPSPHVTPKCYCQVGMGTSTLQEGMVRQGGFTRVVNVDVSKVGEG